MLYGDFPYGNEAVEYFVCIVTYDLSCFFRQLLTTGQSPQSDMRIQ